MIENLFLQFFSTGKLIIMPFNQFYSFMHFISVQDQESIHVQVISG